MHADKIRNTTFFKDTGLKVRRLPNDSNRHAKFAVVHEGFGDCLDELAFWVDHYKNWSADKRPDMKDVSERAARDVAILEKALKELQENR